MSSTAFASLAPPPMEDSMEMSSPADHTLNDDIDIDIDFGDYTGNATDDERMLEDGEPARPGTATDDLMADDDHFNATSALVIEEEMQDSHVAFPPHDADEELIDYDDDEVFTTQDDPHTNFESMAPQNTKSSFLASTEAPTEAPTEVPTELEHVDEEIERQPEGVTVDASSVPAVSKAEAVKLPASAPVPDEQVPLTDSRASVNENIEQAREASSGISHTDPVLTEAPLEDGTIVAADEANGALDADEAEETVTASLHEEQPADEAPAQKLPPQLAGTLDVSGSYVSEGPPTPTDTGLHPMTIQYGDFTWPVFKSRAQQDGLLEDDNLVNVSLADFLYNCRQRLAEVSDEGLSSDHDLVLGFRTVGLLLVEGSSHASTTSLNDVLETFLGLYEIDGVDEVPPLQMTLTTQFKFTKHLALLKQAVADGKGMSEITGTHDHDHEAANVEYDDQAYEDAGPEQNEEFTEEQEAGNENVYDQHENAEYDENQVYQDGDENEQEYNADQYPDQANYEDYGEHEGQAAPEDRDSEYPVYEETAATVSKQGHVQKPDADETQTTGQPDHSATHGQKVVAPDSAASSATVRGDAADTSAETPEDDEEDIFANLVTEDNEQDDQQGVEAQGPGNDDTEHPAALADIDDHQDPDQAAYDDNPDDELNLGTEDFSNEGFAEYPEDQGEDQTEVTGHAYADAVEDLLEYDDDDDLDQGTNVDASHQDDPEHGDGDDQFHTVLDLLDESELPDPPEQDVSADNGQQTSAPELDEDDIGFSDDDEEPAPAVTTNSPHGSLHVKRSFEQHTGDDEIDFDEPEQKKARSG